MVSYFFSNFLGKKIDRHDLKVGDAIITFDHSGVFYFGVYRTNEFKDLWGFPIRTENLAKDSPLDYGLKEYGGLPCWYLEYQTYLYNFSDNKLNKIIDYISKKKKIKINYPVPRDISYTIISKNPPMEIEVIKLKNGFKVKNPLNYTKLHIINSIKQNNKKAKLITSFSHK